MKFKIISTRGHVVAACRFAEDAALVVCASEGAYSVRVDGRFVWNARRDTAGVTQDNLIRDNIDHVTSTILRRTDEHKRARWARLGMTTMFAPVSDADIVQGSLGQVAAQ